MQTGGYRRAVPAPTGEQRKTQTFGRLDASSSCARRSLLVLGSEELIAFRKMLKAERKRGVPVSKLAQEHGISPAYIYQIG